MFTAAANTFGDGANPAAISPADLSRDTAINTLSFVAAADEAVKGFRELPADVAKIVVYTGNILNIKPLPRLMSCGVGKSASAHFIASAAQAYTAEGIK